MGGGVQVILDIVILVMIAGSLAASVAFVLSVKQLTCQRNADVDSRLDRLDRIESQIDELLRRDARSKP